jgi:hypothetical protein
MRTTDDDETAPAADDQSPGRPEDRTVLHRLGAAAARTLGDLSGARVRQVRKMGRVPLASLPDRHPEARNARPVEIGLRSIPVEEIVGTAVGGGDQRGGDFLPLKPFRGTNWAARWARLRQANDRLESLPPIEVVKYADGYWVIDGHNRVALALYNGQVEIDATVVELVPPGARRTEPLGSLSAAAAGSLSVRAAGAGRTPSGEFGHEHIEPSDDDPDPERAPDRRR